MEMRASRSRCFGKIFHHVVSADMDNSKSEFNGHQLPICQEQLLTMPIIYEMLNLACVADPKSMGFGSAYLGSLR